MSIQFTDTFTIDESSRRKTNDGYLAVRVRAARSGLQDYAGVEVGKPGMSRVVVYRPESQVFSVDALHSYGNKPVTNDHPPEQVTAKNWKDFSVGIVGGEVARDGEFVSVPILVTDQTAIDSIERGKVELSAGYTCDLDFTPGKTPDGKAYDAMQKDIRINHLAIVQQGRAGPKCRVGDDNDTTTEGSSVSLKTVSFDGLTIETTDQGAQALTKVMDQVAGLKAAQVELQKTHDAALAKSDAALATADAKVKGLEEKALSDGDLDKLVADRSDLIATVKTMVGDAVKTAGKSVADIKREVVVSKLGDEKKDKSDAYIDAAFDLLGAESNKGTFRNQFTGDSTPNGSTLDGAEKAYDAQIADAAKELESEG